MTRYTSFIPLELWESNWHVIKEENNLQNILRQIKSLCIYYLLDFKYIMLNVSSIKLLLFSTTINVFITIFTCICWEYIGMHMLKTSSGKWRYWNYWELLPKEIIIIINIRFIVYNKTYISLRFIKIAKDFNQLFALMITLMCTKFYIVVSTIFKYVIHIIYVALHVDVNLYCGQRMYWNVVCSSCSRFDICGMPN